MSDLEPGIYKDISFDDYAAWAAVNATTLNGFCRTPAHVYYEMMHGGKERTPALDLGWLVHLAVLEPIRFRDEIVIPPAVDKRSRVGKAMMAEFELENEGKTLVDAESHIKIEAMAAAVLNHETANEFFVKNGGTNELSFVWTDEDSGLLCKGRADRIGSIGEWPIVGDLKTSKDASRREMEKSVYKYGYHIAAAHYLEGLQALYPIPSGNSYRRFVLFVVESVPPYLCAVYEIDESALAEGEVQRRKYLEKYRECVATGIWPGYSSGIDYVSLPPWAFKVFQEND